MAFILGKKIEISQRFKDDQRIPVTVIETGPCFVTQIKTKEKEKYNAIQIGFLPKKKAKKTEKGKEYKYLKEFKVSEEELKKYKLADKITVENFKIGDKIKVRGRSKGKGFAGVVKRHGFKGSPATHGHKDQLRMPGSIGSTGPQRVRKGKKMAGRMGFEIVTIKNLEIIEIDKDKNLLLVKGPIPGAKGTLIEISTR